MDEAGVARARQEYLSWVLASLQDGRPPADWMTTEAGDRVLRAARARLFPWLDDVRADLWRGGREDILPTCGVVSQGPSGLDYYPGTGLGEGFRGHFLMCDFPGGIWDFTVTRTGV